MYLSVCSLSLVATRANSSPISPDRRPVLESKFETLRHSMVRLEACGHSSKCSPGRIALLHPGHLNRKAVSEADPADGWRLDQCASSLRCVHHVGSRCARTHSLGI